MNAPAAAHWPVVVTRDEPADGPLSRELRALGIPVLGWPVLSIGPATDARELDAALRRLDQFEWLVFASQHAVAEVVRRVPVPPAYLNIAAVGARTAQAVAAAGWPVTVVPTDQTAEGLVTALRPAPHTRCNVAIPSRLALAPDFERGPVRRGRQGDAGRDLFDELRSA